MTLQRGLSLLRCSRQRREKVTLSAADGRLLLRCECSFTLLVLACRCCHELQLVYVVAQQVEHLRCLGAARRGRGRSDSTACRHHG
jgi:hypothetical protein